MESGLLNGFQDDNFDDNYVEYETTYWSIDNNSLSLELTETLSGILPMSPTEVNDHYFENDMSTTLFFNENYNNYENDYSKNLETAAYSVIDNTGTTSPVVEVISVDPNCNDYDLEETDSEDDDDFIEVKSKNYESDIEIKLTNNNEDDDNDDDNGDNDNYYRNRTESSSIGDYESYSSDSNDDDDENENEVKNNNKNLNYNNDLKINNKIDNKNPITNNDNSIKPKIKKNINEKHDNKNIANDINNETDDINNIHSNFDLTKYITQDDYNITQLNKIIKTENNSDESDVDVETIQEIEIKPELKNIKNNKIIDYKNTNLSFKSNCNSINIISKIEDDVKNDPSWSPPKSKRKNNNKIKINEIQRKYQIKNKNSQTTTTTTSLPINNKFNGKKLIFNNKIKNNKNLNHNSIDKLKQSSKVSSIPSSSSVIIERKVYGIGRGGKNISMCSRETSLSPTPSSNCDSNKNEILKKDNSSKNDTKKISENFNENQKQTKIEIKTEKNIKIKEESNYKKIDNTNKIKKEEREGGSSLSSSSSSSSQQPVEVNPIFVSDHDYFDEKLAFPSEKNTLLPPVKKKLNLEEYKKRRGVSTAGGDVINIGQNKIGKNVNNENLKSTITLNEEISINDFIQNQITPTKISNSSTSSSSSSSTNKMKILEKLQKSPIDPITEAKNKVLRMKELKKKAALDRIIDSQVSAKVGPVTKILPLEEIVKNSNYMKNYKNEEQYHKKINMNEYEEIIVVSVSLNTDLTIPPEFDRIKKMNSDGLINGNVNNTVVDGASLFYNISDTLQKANSIEISSSSLISSIQDIALKKLNTTTATAVSNSLPSQLSKTATIISDKTIIQKQKSLLKSKNPTIVNSNEKFTNATIPVESEHGEDKIIMHLPKDRIRIPKHTQSVQTIMLPQFPPLQLLLPSNDKLKSVNKIRRRKYRSKRSSSYSSNDDDDGKGNSSYHSSSPRSHHSTSSSRKRSRHNNYNNNDNDNIKINLEIINDNRSRSRSKDSMLSTSSESGIGRRYRGRSRERRKRQRRYSSTSPTDSNSCSSSSSSDSSSESIRSRSRNLSRSSSSSSSVRSRSRSSSRSSYSRSRSNNQYQRNHRSRSRYKRRERNVSPAVEERRIVYVGRIEQETSKDDLKRKFLTYGPIRQITLHYKDTGMKYGFVTYEKAQDAFKAIDNGTRDPKISMYDISFGGRRKFCGATYSDLDGVSTSHLQMCSYPSIIQNSKEEKSDDSFEALLAQVKKKLINNKKPLSTSSIRRDKI